MLVRSMGMKIGRGQQMPDGDQTLGFIAQCLTGAVFLISLFGVGTAFASGDMAVLRNISSVACVAWVLSVGSPCVWAAEPVDPGPPAAVVIGPPPAAPEAQPKRKALKNSVIEIESKFFEVPEEIAKKLGVLPMATPVVPKGGTEPKNAAKAPPIFIPGSAVLAPEVAGKLLQKLNGTRGVDLLSAPRVVARSGTRAVIEMIREFRYVTEFELDKGSGMIVPTAFETRNLGVTMQVEPKAEEDSVIDLNLVPEVVRLDGYVRASDGQPVPLRNGRSVGVDLRIQDLASVPVPKDTVLQPIFSTQKITTSISIFSGNTIVLGGLKREVREKGKKPEVRVLYVLVTARYMDAKDSPPAVLPVAIVDKADEEGFVRSPFAPEARPIDARGLPSGTELKCPKTNQIFRLP
jgi:hypothetical protein